MANLILIPLGYLAIKAGSQMLRVPRNLLMPTILMFCIVGSFAINNTTFDVSIMLFTGILAYFMEANGIPVAPAILGLVLGAARTMRIDGRVALLAALAMIAAACGSGSRCASPVSGRFVQKPC